MLCCLEIIAIKMVEHRSKRGWPQCRSSVTLNGKEKHPLNHWVSRCTPDPLVNKVKLNIALLY